MIRLGINLGYIAIMIQCSTTEAPEYNTQSETPDLAEHNTIVIQVIYSDLCSIKNHQGCRMSVVECSRFIRK